MKVNKITMTLKSRRSSFQSPRSCRRWCGISWTLSMPLTQPHKTHRNRDQVQASCLVFFPEDELKLSEPRSTMQGKLGDKAQWKAY